MCNVCNIWGCSIYYTYIIRDTNNLESSIETDRTSRGVRCYHVISNCKEFSLFLDGCTKAEAIILRVEAIILRVDAIILRVDAIILRVDAIILRVFCYL